MLRERALALVATVLLTSPHPSWADPEEPGGFRGPPEEKDKEPVPPTPLPVATPRAPTPPLAASAPPAAQPKVLPWVVLGVGVVSTGLGIYLISETSDRLNELAQSPLNVDEITARQTKVMTTGLAASVLLSAGTAALVTATTLLLSD